jgi:hypothetical protein
MLELVFSHIPIWAFGVGTFVVLGLVTEAGFLLQRGLDRRARAVEAKVESKAGGPTQILGVTVGLMSLLLSFTFSIAVNRHDARRVLVLSEANAIGTAWLQADLAAEPYRTALEQTLKTYVQVRVDFYEAGDDQATLAQVEQQTSALQAQLWATTGQVVRGSPNTEYSAALAGAMTNVFDHAPARKAAMAARIPVAVLATLSVLLMASAAMLGAVLGEDGVRHHRLLWLVLLAMLAVTMTLIIDIDRPRQSHVRVSQTPLNDLRLQLIDEATEP